MEIGDIIREKREAANLSRLELGEAVGVTQNMIWAIERGRKCPSIRLALDLAKALGCELIDLIGGKSA